MALGESLLKPTSGKACRTQPSHATKNEKPSRPAAFAGFRFLCHRALA
jgi:hypothetical protein